MRITDNLQNCEHCRNHEFILSQLQLLKKEISRKNEKIVELEMFIARISKMALLTDQTDSTTSIYNPMDLTFKNNHDQDDSDAPSVARFRSVSDYYASKSEPHEEGSIY